MELGFRRQIFLDEALQRWFKIWKVLMLMLRVVVVTIEEGVSARRNGEFIAPWPLTQAQASARN
jgi:hypothetical protein